jgi:hypothetical protein
MTYVITIKNAAGAPIDAAYVNFITNGTTVFTLASGADGTISIDTVDDADLFTPGTTMQVTASGYPAFSIPTTSITGNSVVTLGTGSGANVNYGVIAVVAVAGAYLLYHSGGHRVGSAADGGAKTDYSKYILPAGLLLLGYGIYKTIFGPSAGAQQNAANQTAVTQTDVTANTATLNQVLQTQSPTFTASDFASAANSIFSWGQTGNVSSENMDNIEWAVLNTVNNAADWYSLIQAFGIKTVVSGSEWEAILLPEALQSGHPDDLPTYLRGVLDAQHIAAINSFFSAQGINYQL